VPADVVATVMVLQAWRAGATGRRSARCGAISPGRWPTGCGWMTRVPPHRAGVLAQPPACLTAAQADLRGGPPGRGSDRGVQGSGSAGIGLHHPGGRGRHPGHRHAAGRGDPSGPAAGAAGTCGCRGRSRLWPAGQTECAWDDPQAKQALVSGLVNDALAALAAVADPGLDAEQAEAVALLALVTGQDVDPGERPGSWRIARRVAPDRFISTVDPQARHTRRTSVHKRDDGVQGPRRHRTRDRAGHRVLADRRHRVGRAHRDRAAGRRGARLGGAGRHPLRLRADPRGTARRRHLQTIKPIPLQSAVPGGFTVHDFQIDQQAGTARCPAGYTAPITSSCRTSFARHCQRCPLRGRCTTAKRGRTIQVHPHQDELRAAGARATTRSSSKATGAGGRGGTLDRLACRRRLPAGALPRDRTQRPVVVVVVVVVRVAAVNLRRLGVLGLAYQDGAWVLA
jgi:Transposase DDE domain